MEEKKIKKKVVIVDYGGSNIGSLRNMLRYIGVESIVASSPEDIVRSAPIIIPGVGNFAYVKKSLDNLGFSNELIKRAEGGQDILGICVGMQILFDSSEEGGVSGLGLVKGVVKKFSWPYTNHNLPIPHVGWSSVRPSRGLGTGLLQHLPEPARYYFVHSYHAVCDEPSNILFTASHGYSFAAAVASNNVIGFQFHPEKSHMYGMYLLNNWVNHVYR